MPEQKFPSQTRSTSEPPCMLMEELALDTDVVDTDIYQRLGLKELHKGVLAAPRFLSFLSSLLENSILKNEKLLGKAQIREVLTVFHGSRAPTVSLQQYIDRIFKYAGCSPSCFIVAYIYVDRYLQQTETYLTSLNVHRLLVTSVMVAAKFIDDAFFNNAYYARVGGVSTSEMNRLEMKLLFGINFRLQVDVETFRRYCLQLEKEARECEIGGTIKACLIKETWSRKDDSRCNTRVAR